MHFDKSQLMRGTLEGCILKIISLRTTYGYEILELLRKSGFDDLAEGTLYPLLSRLVRQGLLSARTLPSPLGPKRKYFDLTELGHAELSAFEAYWMRLHRSVNRILRAGKRPRRKPISTMKG